MIQKNCAVSVIVVCFNAQDYISACLDSILAQDFKKGAFEIIVVDGQSQDNTQRIVKEYQKNNQNIRLLLNPKRSIASNRNVGLKEASSDLAAFTDADCIVPKEWLSTLFNNFLAFKSKDENVVAVGGNNIPPKNSNNYLSSLGIVLNSFWGSLGSIQGKIYQRPRSVKSLAGLNVLYEKDKLNQLGGFDESMLNMCEEADVNYRLRQEGFRLIYLPNSFVWHRFRPTLYQWVKNIFAYGKGRARLIRKFGIRENLIYILPIIFIIALFLVFFARYNNLFKLALLYFPLIFAVSAFKCLQKKRLNLIFNVFIIYICMHFAYSLGEIYGLLKK